MKPPTKVIVGSQSETKQAAVRHALEELGLQPVLEAKLTGSGKNAQPYGGRETYEGALNRAYANLADTDGDDVWSIGIESGVMPLGAPEHRFDITFVVVRTGGGRVEVATSAGLLVPADILEEAQQRGLATTTVADVVEERFGGERGDPHRALTEDFVSRKHLIAQAVKLAFARIVAS